MKTNVSIKFSSIEEYREIEKKLEEFGYEKTGRDEADKGYIRIYENKVFNTLIHITGKVNKVYNSLEEFLKD